MRYSAVSRPLFVVLVHAKRINVSFTDSPALQSEIRGPRFHTLQENTPGHQEAECRLAVTQALLGTAVL